MERGVRLFTAVNFSAEVKEKLYGIISQMKPLVRKANFTARENLHLTLVFIGEARSYADIAERLSAVRFAPFTVEFGGSGNFKDLYWAGVKPTPELTGLHRAVGLALGAGTDAVYKPHITLAREVIPETKKIDIAVPAFTADVKEFSLMRSDRINGTLKYSEVLKIPAAPR